MLPFQVIFKSGVPVYAQVLYAVKKAVVSGQLRPDDRFPSVRELSQELRINPNTAHKVVSHLVNAGLLNVVPGIGTVVAKAPPGSTKDRSDLLEYEVEHLIVEAKNLMLEKKDVIKAVNDHWQHLAKE